MKKILYTEFLVCGAGISGTVFAYSLMRNGAKVILLEKDRIKEKEKLCGGAISSYDLVKLCNVFQLEEIPFPKTNESKNTYWIYNDYVLEKKGFPVLDRSKLDLLIAENFRNHCGILVDDVLINSIDINNKTAICHFRHSEDICVIRYDFLIVADGAASSLRRMLTGKMPHVLPLFQKTIPKIHNKTLIEIYDDYDGYCWYFPSTETAVLGGGFFADNKLAVNICKRKIMDFSNKFKFDNNKTLRCGCIPCGDDILLSFSGVFFMGDAAGLIQPLLGGGIHYALNSALSLSRVFLESNDKCSAEKKYSHLMEEDIKTITEMKRNRGMYYRKQRIEIMQGNTKLHLLD